MKKKINYLAYIPVVVLFVSMVAGFVRFQVQAETTKTKVDDLKKEVKEATDKNDEELKALKDTNKELEKKVDVNKAQQDNIQREVQQINDKTDKIYEVLLQIDKKKK
jgi:peptidoglycan hydrolase CwlO-like protein